MTDKGFGRIYEDGRSTRGWIRGKRITDPSELKPGTILISVNHAFRTESLVLITAQSDLLPGFWAVWVNPEGLYGFRDIFSIQMSELDPQGDQEYYIAVPYEEQPVSSGTSILTIELFYDDYEPEGGQQTPSYQKSILYDTRLEAEASFNELSQELRLMGWPMEKRIHIYLEDFEAERTNAVEALRCIAAFYLGDSLITSSEYDPYWNRFSPAKRGLYVQKGQELG